MGKDSCPMHSSEPSISLELGCALAGKVKSRVDLALVIVCMGDRLESKEGEEDPDEDEEFQVEFKSLAPDFLGSHESSVGKAAGGRFGLNSMGFGNKDERIRVSAGGGGGGDGDETALYGIRSGSMNDSSSYLIGALTFLRSCILRSPTQFALHCSRLSPN